MNYKNLAAIACAALALAVGGCSSDDSPSRIKIQYVNGTHAFGTVEFEARGVRHSVAPRAASPVIEVEPGPLTVTLRSEAGAITVRELSIDETTTFLVAYRGITGNIDVRTLSEGSPLPGGNTAVTYHHDSSETIGVDVYFVPPGTDIAAASPSNPAPLGRPSTLAASFAPGTYEMVIAPAGKKTILFRSAPMELRASQHLTLLGATRSMQVVTPQPIVLQLGAVRSLEDSRPAVRLLSDLTPETSFGQTLFVDGDVVAYLASPRAASGSFHITPGTRMFQQIGALPNGAHPQEILAGQSYTLRYRQDGFGTNPVAFIGWGFFLTTDYPIPAGKARVRVFVESLREQLVKVDGQVVTYANQSLGNAGLLLERDPGAVSIEVFTPDTVLSEGVVNLTLQANRYYVVRFLSTTGRAGPWPYPPGGPPVPRRIEVSSD